MRFSLNSLNILLVVALFRIQLLVAIDVSFLEKIVGLMNSVPVPFQWIFVFQTFLRISLHSSLMMVVIILRKTDMDCILVYLCAQVSQLESRNPLPGHVDRDKQSRKILYCSECYVNSFEKKPCF